MDHELLNRLEQIKGDCESLMEDADQSQYETYLKIQDAKEAIEAAIAFVVGEDTH